MNDKDSSMPLTPNALNVRPFKSKLAAPARFIRATQSHLIEIGCGVGFHPLLFAKQNPGKKLIALERTKNKFTSFERRLQNHPDVKNITAINEDAHDWLPKSIPPNSVEKYFLLYPNPYPKESQANKRWHRCSLMHYMLETLIPGGEIEIATNELFYFEEALLYLQSFWKLDVQHTTVDPKNQPRTHFEKKYLSRGETCYNIIATKNYS